jgi:hypothetical protein
MMRVFSSLAEKSDLKKSTVGDQAAPLAPPIFRCEIGDANLRTDILTPRYYVHRFGGG